MGDFGLPPVRVRYKGQEMLNALFVGVTADHLRLINTTLALGRFFTDPDDLLSTETLAGRVSLVNVWGTWCVECRHEHAFLVELARAGLPIYGLNVKDDRAAAIEWLSRLGDPYVTSGFDPDGVATAEATATQREGPFVLHGTPTNYIISPRGRIAGYIAGSVDWTSDAARAFISYFLQEE